MLQQLEPGQVSMPVHVDQHVYVFYATKKEAETYRPYQEVTEPVRSQYIVIGTEVLYDKLLTGLKERKLFTDSNLLN